MSLVVKFVLTLGGLCAISLVSASAQTLTTARIVGAVRDTQGAAIAGAEVRAQNLATSEIHTTSCDDAGNYVVPSLTPGSYQITVTAHGFSPARFPDLLAGISGTTTVNAVLKVARPVTEITVSDAPPLIQSTSPELPLPLNAPTPPAL